LSGRWARRKKRTETKKEMVGRKKRKFGRERGLREPRRASLSAECGVSKTCHNIWSHPILGQGSMMVYSCA
jgi:hypothetical protein